MDFGKSQGPEYEWKEKEVNQRVLLILTHSRREEKENLLQEVRGNAGEAGQTSSLSQAHKHVGCPSFQHLQTQQRQEVLTGP